MLTAPRQVSLGDEIYLDIAISGKFTQKTVLSINQQNLPLTIGTQTISLGTANKAGARIETYILRSGNAISGRGDFTVLVEDPLQVVAPPALNEQWELTCAIQNKSTSQSYEVSSVQWRSNNDSGKGAENLMVPAGKTTMIKLPAFAAVPYVNYPLNMTISFKERVPIKLEDSISYSPVHSLSATVDGDLSEWQDKTGINLYENGTVEVKDKVGFSGAEDLSGQIWLAADETYLYIAAQIEDQTHAQTESGRDVWKGDGIQFSLAPSSAEDIPQWHEFGLSLTKKGPELWRWMSPEGASTGRISSGQVEAKREGTVTSYECAIPWSDLTSLHSEAPTFLFSILVNDNDGSSRKGWIEWGSGIGRNKNPSLFRTVQRTK